MKKKISVTINEDVYEKIMALWKEEQKKALNSEIPEAVKVSEIVEKILRKGLKMG
jgi:hypothetical protein